MPNWWKHPIHCLLEYQRRCMYMEHNLRRTLDGGTKRSETLQDGWVLHRQWIEGPSSQSVISSMPCPYSYSLAEHAGQCRKADIKTYIVHWKIIIINCTITKNLRKCECAGTLRGGGTYLRRNRSLKPANIVQLGSHRNVEPTMYVRQDQYS